MNPEKNHATRQKVLIVDDNQVIVKTIATQLNQAGYETLEAADGAQATALARKEKPDLIVLDLNFAPDVNGVPGDGYRIMEWLRRFKESRNIPIITITGFPDNLDMERNLDFGALGFVFKPLDYNKLLRLVRSVLGASVTLAA